MIILKNNNDFNKLKNLLKHGPEKFIIMKKQIRENYINSSSQNEKIIVEAAKQIGITEMHSYKKVKKHIYNDRHCVILDVGSYTKHKTSAFNFEQSLKDLSLEYEREELDGPNTRFFIYEPTKTQLFDIEKLAWIYDTYQPKVEDITGKVIEEDIGNIVATALTKGPQAVKQQQAQAVNTPAGKIASTINAATNQNSQLKKQLSTALNSIGIKTESLNESVEEKLKSNLLSLLAAIKGTKIKKIPFNLIVKNIDSQISVTMPEDKEFIENLLLDIPFVDKIENGYIFMTFTDETSPEEALNDDDDTSQVKRMAKQQLSKDDDKKKKITKKAADKLK